jgi:hypothetical protein
MILFEELRDFCKGKSIILVGNAASMLQKKNGKAIDGHDIVLRMNHGYPRPGLEPYTGVKTDLWAISFKNQALQRIDNEIFNARYNIVMRTFAPPFIAKEVAEKAYFSKQEWYYELQRKINGGFPSTGCMIVDFFVSYISGYRSLAITGFDHFESPEFYRERSSHSIHSPKEEKQFIRKLIADKCIMEL